MRKWRARTWKGHARAAADIAMGLPSIHVTLLRRLRYSLNKELQRQGFERLDEDHIRPIKQGGVSDIYNLRLIPMSVNRGTHHRSEAEIEYLLGLYRPIIRVFCQDAFHPLPDPYIARYCKTGFWNDPWEAELNRRLLQMGERI